MHDASDEFGFGVGGEGCDEGVAASFPFVAAGETEPDEGVDT